MRAGVTGGVAERGERLRPVEVLGREVERLGGVRARVRG